MHVCRAVLFYICKQVFIDVLARGLLIHNRVSKAFLRTVTYKPSNDVIDAMEAGKRSKPIALNDGKGQLTTENLLSANERLRQIEDTLMKAGDPAAMEKDCDVRILRIQWRNIALVMDRLFFVLYFFTLVITLAVLFPRPQHTTEFEASMDD